MPAHRNAGRALLIFAIAMLLPTLAWWLRLPPDWRPWLAGWIGGLSLATFAVYATDKRHAKQGDPRTPETTLHLLGLIGGWPGALLAQQWLRHKTAKPSFQTIFWLVVALYEYLALDWLLHWQISGRIAGLFS